MILGMVVPLGGADMATEAARELRFWDQRAVNPRHGEYAGSRPDLAHRYPEQDAAERQRTVEKMMALIREIVRLGPV